MTDAATGKPVPDVVLTATSEALQGEEVVVTDATGVYRLAQLPPGTYTLRLEKEGFKPYSRTDISVRVDRTVRVNIQLQPESVTADTIVVVGKPPTVDVGSTTTGIVVGREFIDNIAFIRPSANGIRSFESLAAVAPQVAGDSYGYGFSGTTSPENGVYIDGLNVNNAQTGTNGAQMPVDFIQEANIITGGYMAEYGRAGGGVINAVTKSGSNEFHGSVWANYSPGLLTAISKPIANVSDGTALTNQVWNVIDFGADVGGPIIKDRLWFYVGVAPSFYRRQQRQTVARRSVIQDPDDPTDTVGIYDTNADGSFKTDLIPNFALTRFDDRRAITYIARLTFLINSDHNISLSVNGANSTREVPTTFDGQMTGFVQPASNLALSLKYSGAFIDRKLLVDATAGWFHQTELPYGLPYDGSKIGDTTGAAGTSQVILRRGYSATTPNAQPYNLPEYRDLPADVVAACTAPNGLSLAQCPITGYGATYAIGGFGFMQSNINDRFAATAKVSYLLNALGHHVFKGGIDFERAIYDTTKAYSGGVQVRQSFGGGSYTDVRRFAYLNGPTIDDVVEIPVVHVTPTTNQVGVFLQDSWSIMDVVTLNAGVRYDNQVLFDGNGQQAMALNNMWSPRIGAVYDFTQQGRSKIFANFSRYYQSIPLNIADRALSGENQVTTVRLAGMGCDPSVRGTGPGTYQANCQNYNVLDFGDSPSHFAIPTGQGRTPIDPNLQAQAKDEFVAGGEYEIIPDLRVGVTYTKSWMLNVIEDMSNDEANTYFIGNPGSGLARDFPRATRDYDAVTVLATKAFSDGWMGQFSYTWSYLRGNWAGFFRPETDQIDPGTNADFDLRSLLTNRTGPLPGDRTHFFKFYASKTFQVTNNISLGLGVTYEGSSGTPISYLGGHPLYGADEAFILERGAAGRTPWVHSINLKGMAGYKFNKDTGVQFTVDVLNAFNFQAATTVDQSFTQQAVLPYTPAAGENPQEAICAGGATAGPGCVGKVTVIDADTFAPREDGAGNPAPLTDADLNKNFKQPTAYQLPLQVRFGLRFTF
ncbi:MAG: TonB-dependent receptor [Archangium sp.]